VKTVWIVIGTQGEHSGRDTWLVRAFESEPEAQAWAAGAQAYCATSPCDRWDADRSPEYADWQRANPWDQAGAGAVQWEEADYPTANSTYSVAEVPFGTVIAGVSVKA